MGGKGGSVGEVRPRWLPTLLVCADSDGCRTISRQHFTQYKKTPNSVAAIGQRSLRRAAGSSVIVFIVNQELPRCLNVDGTRSLPFRLLFDKGASRSPRPQEARPVKHRRPGPEPEAGVGGGSDSSESGLRGGPALGKPSHTAWPALLGIFSPPSANVEPGSCSKNRNLPRTQSRILRLGYRLSTRCLAWRSEPFPLLRFSQFFVNSATIAYSPVKIHVLHHWAATAQGCPATACKEIQPWQATHPQAQHQPG